MKIRTTTLYTGLAFLFQSALFAQVCTPLNPFPPDAAFIYPEPYTPDFPQGGIADTALVGISFETVLHINVPPTFIYQGQSFPLYAWILAPQNAIIGLPPSMNYDCNPPNCLFNANTPGCIVISGTAGGFEVGIHDLYFTGNISSLVTVPLVLPAPTLLEGNYYLHIQNCPNYNSAESDSVCAGDNYTFPDGTMENNIQAPITHVSHFLAINGCDSLVTTTLEVTALDLSVMQDGATLTANASGSSFQWIDCADSLPIEGETGAVFKPTATGSYAVIVTAGNNCQDTSACFNVTINGVSEKAEGQAIRLSPNPVSHQLRIELPRTVQSLEVAIFDIQGKNAFAKSYSNTRSGELDVSALTPGLYVAKIHTEEGISVLRFMKQ